MKNIYRFAFLLLAACSLQLKAFSQDMMPLIKKVKAKLDKVNDYTASGSMKTDVAFIKAPVGKVTMYYKKPNKFKLKKAGGISILPKGGISVNMNNVLSEKDFVAISAGKQMVGSFMTTVVKLIPTSETSDIILSTLYIDETDSVIRKAVTTTKENGTYEMEMSYGKYLSYGLPSKLTFSFNTKDYKMPKGITMEFGDESKEEKEKLKQKKGKVEITYSSYTINKGVADSVFTSGSQ
jgi:outer membrane lipoprotein-sorting protein